MASRQTAETAFEAAQGEIERLRRAKAVTELDLSGEFYPELDRIPPEVAGIEGLTALYLNDTKVSDLSPLRDLTTLRTLRLNQTAVKDLSPLRDLTALQDLWLDETAVSDLSPLSGLTALKELRLTQTDVNDISPLYNLTSLQTLLLIQTAVSDLSPLRDLTALQTLMLALTAVSDLSPLCNLTALQKLGFEMTAVRDLQPISALAFPASTSRLIRLSFFDTPATAQDPELRALSHIEDPEERARKTLAYLRTLPPWQGPLPWPPDRLDTSAPHEPSRQGETFPPAIPLPAGLRRITLAEARHILVSDRPQLRARCQHVVAELDDALAMQAVRIPNEPDQLAAHTAITNSLTLAKAALMGLHEALPDDDLDRPVTEAEVAALRAAFDALLGKLKQAAAYVDRADHTPTYGGLLRMGCATGVASVLCLFPGVAMMAAIPAVYTMFYGGPAAIKALGEIGKKAGGA